MATHWGVVRFRSFNLAACVSMLCGCGGSGSEPGAAPPVANTPPALAGTPATVAWEGDPYVFAPQAEDADGDTLVFEIDKLPRWASFDSATGRLRGVPAPTDVGENLSIRIGVSDGRERVWLPRFDLTVREVSSGSALVAWEAPTENTDGTALDDLAGFNIYWGTDPKWPTASVAVAGIGIAAYRVSGLAPGVYYFATTAVNSMGLESEPSDVAKMVVR